MTVKKKEPPKQKVEKTREIVTGKTIDLITFYNHISKDQGIALPPHLIPVCIAAEDRRIEKLQVIVPPGAGKSYLLSVIYPAYLLGKFPTTTILGISVAEDLIKGFMHAVAETIEFNRKFSYLFPEVKPDKKAGWSSDKGYFVTGRTPGDPDASYFGAGLESKTVEGKHATEIVLDDLHSSENSSDSQKCAKIIDRYYSTILGRQSPKGCRIRLAGRRWHEADCYGHFQRVGDWVTMVLPAERENSTSLWWDVYVPEKVSCHFTEGAGEEVQSDIEKHRKFRAYYGVDPKREGFYWPLSEGKRKEYLSAKFGRPDWARAVYLCDPGAGIGTVFTPQDIKRFSVENASYRLSRKNFPEGTRFFSAWDMAYSDSPDSAYSVGMIAAAFPCNKWHRNEMEELIGKADQHYDVYIVDVIRGKFDIRTLAENVREFHKNWNTEADIIEEKASGISIVQALSNSGIPIVPVKVRVGKRERALQSIDGGAASVQGWFRMGRVQVWGDAPWFRDFENELLSFTGSRNETTDQVDALVHLITYIIQLGTQRALLPSLSSQQEFVEIQSPAMRDRNNLLGLLRLGADDPLAGMNFCKECAIRDENYFCPLMKRRVMVIESCEAWKRRISEDEKLAEDRRLVQ